MDQKTGASTKLNRPAGDETIGKWGRIFCLEGDWEGHLTDKSSVRPMLELLAGLGVIDFVHKDVGTRAELNHYLGLWAEDDGSVSDFYTLYLAFHGTDVKGSSGRERGIWLSNATDGVVSLSELAEMIGDRQNNVVLHIGSCSVLNERDDVLRSFCERTGIKALVGYMTDVNWIESAAMDMLFFSAIADYSRWPYAQAAIEGNEHLRRSLGFRIFVA